MPEWLTPLAWVAVIAAVVSALVIVGDVLNGHRQHMWIMNVVWPLTALYAGPFAVLAYFKVGRRSTQAAMQARESADSGPGSDESSLARSAALGATHCGAGCALGDLIAESFVVAVPITLFGRPIFGTWALDFVLAFLLGIAFQYFTIAPMRNLGVRDGIVAALKADTASLTAWQIGMYGWMAIATFAIFGHEIDKSGPVFWFMMQIAMVAGFAVAWPVNAVLIRAGWKERM
ncbi:MAG: DUF4396 domain-containing protein [Betaproteobacteria bacterium]